MDSSEVVPARVKFDTKITIRQFVQLERKPFRRRMMTGPSIDERNVFWPEESLKVYKLRLNFS